MSLSHSELKRIATRYVDALFALAREQSALDPVARDLGAFHQAIAVSPELQKLLRNPMVDKASMQRVFAGLSQKIGIAKLTEQFLHTVIDNKRAEILACASELYQERLSAHRGIIHAEVTTAKPITAAQKDKLHGALKSASGKEVEIATKVDPKLIGGMVLRVGSRMLDRSVAGKLQRLKVALKASAA